MRWSAWGGIQVAAAGVAVCGVQAPAAPASPNGIVGAPPSAPSVNVIAGEAGVADEAGGVIDEAAGPALESVGAAGAEQAAAAETRRAARTREPDRIMLPTGAMGRPTSPVWAERQPRGTTRLESREIRGDPWLGPSVGPTKAHMIARSVRWIRRGAPRRRRETTRQRERRRRASPSTKARAVQIATVSVKAGPDTEHALVPGSETSAPG